MAEIELLSKASKSKLEEKKAHMPMKAPMAKEEVKRIDIDNYDELEEFSFERNCCLPEEHKSERKKSDNIKFSMDNDPQNIQKIIAK